MRSMLQTYRSSALVCSAARSPAAIRGRSPDASRLPGPIFAYPIQKTVLDNGLTVLSVPFDSPGIIAYYTIVRTGSRNEVEKGLSGFAHFFEHMMFRGTDAYPQEKYNDVLKSLGADSNAYTNDDWTCYHMTIPATALATAVEIEADRFQNLKYDEPSFQKEARAVLGEYNKSASSPFQKLNETMQNTAYTTHTYKHTTIGFLADIKDMPNQYAYSKVFFDRWYRPENCTIIVAGDVKHDALVALVKQYYGGWKRGKAQVEIPAEPPQTEPKVGATDLAAADACRFCTWAYHIPAGDPANPDTAALGALEQALFGETSPLYQELVLKEQKVVHAGGRGRGEARPGPLLDSRAGAEARRSARSCGHGSPRPWPRPPRPRSIRLDWTRSSRIFATRSPARCDTADAVADAVGTAVATTGRPESINELFAAYDRLTPADLQRVAAKYFQPSNETAIILETEIKK